MPMVRRRLLGISCELGVEEGEGPVWWGDKVVAPTSLSHVQNQLVLQCLYLPTTLPERSGL